MVHDNSFFFIRAIWGCLRHAEWGAAAARGPLALIVEFFRALLGFSAWPFFIPMDGGWRPHAVGQILDAHGIEHWGWGRHGRELVFQVKLRQASWAQYLLQQHGVPIGGRLLDERTRSAYRPAPRRSLRPNTSGASAPFTPSGANASFHTGQPAHAAPPMPPLRESLRDPVGQINRAVDRLAKW